MAEPSDLDLFLGSARLATYLAAAENDHGRAQDLYLWVTELSGALHAQLSYVEVAVRNAIDVQLMTWNDAQGCGREWTAPGQTAAPLYQLLRTALSEARQRAQREAEQRHPQHARYRAAVPHDDVVAQLMFGAWVKVVQPFSTVESSQRQEHLWTQAVRHAFPRDDQSEAGRRAVGSQLDALRRLRNRGAHHDNLLEVNVSHRLNDILALLSKVNAAFPSLAAARSPVRRINRQDPRRSWTVGRDPVG